MIGERALLVLQRSAHLALHELDTTDRRPQAAVTASVEIWRQSRPEPSPHFHQECKKKG